MVNWVCYPTGEEPDMWTTWHRLQDGSVKGRHATALRFLTEGYWKKPHFKHLKGDHLKGLGEICISGKVEWRLIGFRDAVNNSFTVVMICNHKDGVYSPVDAFDRAARRRKEMLNGLKGVILNAHPR